MNQDKVSHWQTVYHSKTANEVSWYKPHLEVSLSFLREAGLNQNSSIIDVGAGTSTLIDDLLDLGVEHITALDISAASLNITRQRLGPRARLVNWRVDDILRAQFDSNSYDFWHDRAALHFLVEPADAARYVAITTHALKLGGHALIGCFAADGPEKCSQLPIVRREPANLAALFGAPFSLIHAQHERHSTPWGTTQSFAYALPRKIRDK